MAQEIDIINMALSLIGQKPITSILDPQTVTEQLCALQYPLLRDAVMEEVEWSFAIKRFVDDQPAAAEPEWGYPYKFPLSTETLRVLYCSDKKDENIYNAGFHWVVEDGFILADSAVIYYRAIQKIIDATKFSNLFVQALSARLAMELCIPITENAKLHASLASLYNSKIKAAGTMDNMQGKSTRLRVGRLHAARGGI